MLEKRYTLSCKGMRKLLFYTILILLVILTGCSDFSSPNTDPGEQAVEIETLSRGDIIQAGESIDIEYTINESETPVNRLNIVITGPDSEIIEDMEIEEEPLSGWVNPVELDESAKQGLYSIRFDFYSDEEVIFSEIREFFIAPAIGGIRSIASYPPVLYPGGGGLFHAETDAGCDDCWLRWSLDDDVIAEGAGSDGYGSIEIKAPDSEGVYNLSLELFPFAPAESGGYDFGSSIRKEIPLYVNTEQKSGVNEFEDSDGFFSLFQGKPYEFNRSRNIRNRGACPRWSARALCEKRHVRLSSQRGDIIGNRSTWSSVIRRKLRRFFRDDLTNPLRIVINRRRAC